MKDKRKLKLKKFYFHPITMFLFLIVITIFISFIFSLFQMQATYNIVNENTISLESTLVTVENLLSADALKSIISNATTNFLSFTPLAMILISLIGISIAEASGFIKALTDRHLSKLSNNVLTFILIFLAVISSLINEVGYALLIPLAGLIYFIRGRNPILGIVTAFCGVAFGYGVSIFVGSMEVALMGYTKSAAMLIDENIHISLSSNLFFIIITSIIISIIGAIVIEKIIAPKLGKYKKTEIEAKTEQYTVIDLEEEEQKLVEQEKRQKSGLRYSLITAIFVIAIFIYSIIPNLLYSGLLLDTDEQTYLGQLFGENAFFQDGFTVMLAILLSLTGIAYAIGAKSVKNDKDLINKASSKLSNIGSVILLIFIFSQFIYIFKMTNIGIVIAGWLANLIEFLNFDGLPLVITSLIVMAIANLFLTSSATKWLIFSPVVIPMFMQSNISPEFAQIVARVADSMTNGATFMLASFSIYIAYLNIYNLDKEKPIGIHKSLRMVTPYFLIIGLAWILLVAGWYIISLPIGPGTLPTL